MYVCMYKAKTNDVAPVDEKAERNEMNYAQDWDAGKHAVCQGDWCDPRPISIVNFKWPARSHLSLQRQRLQHIRNVLACAVFAVPRSSILATFSDRLKHRDVLNTKLFPPRVSSSSLLLRVTCVISSQSSLHDPLNQPHWSLFSNHQLTPVSRSQTALFGMLHLTCGTSFVHVPYQSGASLSPSFSPSLDSDPGPVVDISHGWWPQRVYDGWIWLCHKILYTLDCRLRKLKTRGLYLYSVPAQLAVREIITRGQENQQMQFLLHFLQSCHSQILFLF